MTLYGFVKFLHILLAMVAVGFSASYIVWIGRASREPASLSYVLKGVRFIDARFTNPAFTALLLTGLLMVVMGGFKLTTFWIDAAVILFIVVALLGIFVYAPTFKRMRLAAENGATPRLELDQLVQRSIVMNAMVGTIVLVILALMVFKPGI